VILHRIANVVKKLAEKIQPIPVHPQQFRVIPWFKANGDKTLRLDYDELSIDSLVFDLGGYEGQWSSDIYSKYNCAIFVFEPYPLYAENIRKRFAKNHKIRLFDMGLSAKSEELDLTISDDSSSTHKSGDRSVKIKVQQALEFFTTQAIDCVDLMKINIEGGEYDLLDHLLASNLILKVKNIQIQFHDFVPDAFERMKNIQKGLSKTHELTYQYEFVWENWRLKRNS
jgi:FkbM family methyltransferase